MLQSKKQLVNLVKRKTFSLVLNLTMYFIRLLLDRKPEKAAVTQKTATNALNPVHLRVAGRTKCAGAIAPLHLPHLGHAVNHDEEVYHPHQQQQRHHHHLHHHHRLHHHLLLQPALVVGVRAAAAVLAEVNLRVP